MNLLTSFSEAADEEKAIINEIEATPLGSHRGRSTKSSAGTFSGKSSGRIAPSAKLNTAPVINYRTDEWMDEYKLGCDWEIYKSDFPLVFDGNLFSELAVR